MRGLIARTVWAEMPEPGTLQPGQAAVLAGFTPHSHDGGQTTGKRHITQGRASLRRVLHMAAIAASRFNPVLAPFHARMIKRGKPAKLALQNPKFCLVR